MGEVFPIPATLETPANVPLTCWAQGWRPVGSWGVASDQGFFSIPTVLLEPTADLGCSLGGPLVLPIAATLYGSPL